MNFDENLQMFRLLKSVFQSSMKLSPDHDFAVPKIKVEAPEQNHTTPLQLLLLAQARRRAKAVYEFAFKKKADNESDKREF